MASDSHAHHITPFRTLLFVFLGLVALTALTVYTATQVNLGPFNVPLALTIAVAKAGLVVAFFMALKYDNRVNSMVLAIGVIMVVAFISFTLFDTAWRGDIGNVGAETIEDEQRRLEELQSGASAGQSAEPGTTSAEQQNH